MAPFVERVHAQRWLGLAVLSLVLAGLLSLLLVVGRAPGLAELFTDPLFFRRGLVVHVDLALVVWFNAFLVALAFLVPSWRRPGLLARAGSVIALAGVAMLVAAAGLPGAEPVLSNYVPAIDHPLFVAGLVAFAAGVVLSLADRRLLPANERPDGFFPLPASARVGIRAAALAVLLAALTFATSASVTARDLPAETYYELVAWGGGHVLQVAGVAGMLAVWLALAGGALGRDPIGRRTAVVLFGALVAPFAAAPLLAAGIPDVTTAHVAFTTLMRWATWPVVVVVGVLVARALVRNGVSLRDRRVLALAASAALAVTGFVLGALIRGADTTVPAHYHASIGAVTVAYMAMSYPVIGRLGLRLPEGRLGKLCTVQPVLFAAGQLVFAIGFAIAGSAGMGRKTYAAEQHVTGLADAAGLLVMGAGGLVAVTAGVLFLVVVVRAWLGRPVQARGGIPWRIESIRSRS